jgi:uncharacterized protein (DUF1499 family)
MNKILLLTLIVAISACSGSRPSNLGINDGALAPCPESPNCVVSFADKTDEQHAIAAIAYSDNNHIMQQLKALLEASENAEIVSVSEYYVHAEFVSSLMRFVDDVEFYIVPEQQLIHVRSASRLGRSDFGVNRQRIEMLRNQIK